MKYLWRFLTFLLIATGLMAGVSRADAQNISMSAAASPNPVIVSNTATFTISLTNLTGSDLANLQVSNTFSSPIQIANPTASIPQGNTVIDSNSIAFQYGLFPAGGILILTFQATPTNTGSFTDTILAVSPPTLFNASAQPVLQSVTSTNVVPTANLGVAIAGPAQAVITNDLITYNVSVTNATATAVSGVIVTNVLPPGIIFKSVAPSNLKLTTVHSNQIFSLGTMQASGFTNIAVTIEPTNAGIITLSAFINSSGGLSSNSVNSATTNITVMDPLPGSFTIVTNSQQVINLQNGLTEQTVLLSNTSTTDAPAVRIVVDNLSKHLFNAVGTNDNNPFVYYSAPLPAGSSATLRLQFSPRSFFSFTNTLQAYAVPTPDWSPPPGILAQLAGTNGAAVGISNQLASSGSILIEFPATLGRSYTIVYADNSSMSNAMIAPPAVVAPANRVQWIDYGPPTTISPPGSAGMRFYEVFLNQ